ncbi:MAG: hypothetical protein SVR94_15020 [Pseudomonadota bacterium]|nr:hypothetical protein [Pseudomonadota bacterium]
MKPKRKLLDDPLLKTQNIDHLLKTQNIGKHRIKIYLGGPVSRWFLFKRWLGRSLLALIIFFTALMTTRYFLETLKAPNPQMITRLQQCHQYLAHKAIESASHCYKKILEQDKHNALALTGLETIAELRTQSSPPQVATTPLQSETSAATNPAVAPQTRLKTTTAEPTFETQSTTTKPIQSASKTPDESTVEPALETQTATTEPIQSASKTPAESTVEPALETQIPKTATDTQEQLTALLQQCEQHFQANRLTSGRSGTAYQCYQNILSQHPSHPAAQRGLQRIEHRYRNWLLQELNRERLSQARHYLKKIRLVNPDSEILTDIDNFYQDKIETALAEDETEGARHYLAQLKRFNPDSTTLKKLQPKLAAQTEDEPTPTIAALLQQCERHFQANRLTSGRSGTAFACYRQVLSQQPENQTAQQGLKRIEARYQAWIERALQRAQYRRAHNYLQKLKQVNPNSSALARLQKQLSALESTTPPPSQPQPKKSLAVPAAQRLPAKAQCGEIFAQESLGIQPLTAAQRQFKQRYCN